MITQTPHARTVAARARAGERGAALITVLLVSMLLLAAGGALIMTTMLSATNTFDSTAEAQAYYAAEAGLQATLGVLRGNVAPLSPSGNAADNKVTFRQAVTSPGNLSRWLPYDQTYSRVPISAPPYAPVNGMAYGVEVTDPDNRGTVIFKVTGAFAGGLLTFDVGTSSGTRATFTYTPPATNPLTINSSGTAPFGTFKTTPQNGAFNSYDTSTIYPQGIDFNLTVTQTAPYPATSAAPLTIVIPCKLRGVISTTPSQNTAHLDFVPPTTNPAGTTNSVGGVTYARAANNFSIPYNAATQISPVVVTAPEPARVLVKVIGYGPRASVKRMQMLISRFAFDFTASAAITLRSSDSGSAMSTFDIGSSANYAYSGNDNSGGPGLPAFSVTNSADYAKVLAAVTGNAQVTGSSSVQQLSPSSLTTFLQTAQGARDAVDFLRESSKNTYWPAGTDGEANDRYFPAGSSPSGFGTESDPVTTFVDGDVALPPAGGAGLLVVTGTLDMRGSADFKGLVLVLGGGKVLRNGGGNGTTLGALAIASFGATGDFLPPYFDSNGGGIAGLSYDSRWVERGLMTAGPSVRGVSEY